MQLFLNFDKAFVGLLLVGWGRLSIHSWKQWRNLLRRTLPIVLVTSVILLGLSLFSGAVRFDPKWFEFSGYWLVFNLLFTCVAEEAFFRGFVQKHLGLILDHRKNGLIEAWVLTSVFFGICHYRGGWVYAILAMIAGFFYGFAYLKTKRIEASILTHFTVNAVHFLAFTYPLLRTSL